MKYIIIPYIALGLVLSLAIGIEYSCVGYERFPTYYGSPIVFKQESLASSMEYFYSISGLIINILIWSSALFLIDTLIKKISKPKLVRILYTTTICIMIVFTTLNIAIDWITHGNGFSKDLNYWYWDMDKDAKDWGMTCEGKVVLLGK